MVSLSLVVDEVVDEAVELSQIVSLCVSFSVALSLGISWFFSFREKSFLRKPMVNDAMPFSCAVDEEIVCKGGVEKKSVCEK